MTEDPHNTEGRERFAQVLQHLCMRPKMYTFDGTFRQVIVYIEAYLRGCGFPKSQINLESGMEPFGRWLADKFGHEETHSWHQILLQHCGGDEEQALDKLWPLYEEYLACGVQNI